MFELSCFKRVAVCLFLSRSGVELCFAFEAGAEASLAEAAGGLWAHRGKERGGCAGRGDGAALGVVWESRLMIIASQRCHTQGCRQAQGDRHS